MTLYRALAAGTSTAMLMAAASSPALAGSVIRPGDTIGNPAGKPIPPGLYFVNTLTYECRDIANHKTCATPNVPVIAWSTPWTVAGARLHILAAPLVPLHLGVKNAPNRSGLFNPFIGAQLAWDLGQDFSVSYLLGTYVKTHGEVAYSSTSLNQRLALTYTGDGLNLTANVILGTHFDKVSHRPQISPCPPSAAHPSNGCNPDYLNIDLTATKKFGDWELGPVGTFSTDLNKPTPEYKKQSQFQLGGLVGRNINNKAIVQLYVTADVYQKNYGASIVTGNFRIILPILPPKGAPLQPITN
jgi:hypothetical protein